MKKTFPDEIIRFLEKEGIRKDEATFDAHR